MPERRVKYEEQKSHCRTLINQSAQKEIKIKRKRKKGNYLLSFTAAPNRTSKLTRVVPRQLVELSTLQVTEF